MASTYRNSAAFFSFLEKELIPFPWSRYSQVPVRDFLHGGVENTMLTVFPQASVTDSWDPGLNPYLGVNAHELVHQWFGDLVTAPGARDHWLQEGFASFYSILARSRVIGREEGLYQWQQMKVHVFEQEKRNPQSGFKP